MRDLPPLRSLPRVFLPGADPSEPIELPAAELDKFRKVLRLSTGDPIAVLPNDGSLIRCRLDGRRAVPESVEHPDTEPALHVTLYQAMPKGERLETVVRMGTELGVSRFVVFPARRSVAKWEPAKRPERLRRLAAIAREAAEQSFRSRLPEIDWVDSLADVLARDTEALVLSEVEGVPKSLREEIATRRLSGRIGLVIGPEGGWDPRELASIGDRGVSLGPLVLRTDTAGLAAAALALLGG